MVHSQQSLLAWALRRPMPNSQLSVDACHKARQAHAAQLGLPWHLAAARWSPGRPTRAQLWAQPIANQLLQNNFEGVARLEDLEPPAWFHAFRSELIHELLISHSASHGQELVQYTWPVQNFRIPWVCVFDGDLAYMKPLKAAECLMTDDKPEAPVGITSAGGGAVAAGGKGQSFDTDASAVGEGKCWGVLHGTSAPPPLSRDQRKGPAGTMGAPGLLHRALRLQSQPENNREHPQRLRTHWLLHGYLAIISQ